MSIARNSGLALGAQVIGMAGGIATSILTARFLGPSGRGVLVLVNFTVMLLMVLAGLGLNSSLVYMIGKRKVSRQQGLGIAAIAAVALGGTAMLLAIAAYPLLRSNVFSGIGLAPYAIGLAALPAALFNDLWAWLRIGENRFEQATAYQAGWTLTSVAIATVALWLLGLNVTYLIAIMTIAHYGWAITLFVLSVRQEGVSFNIERPLLGEIARYGSKVYFGSLVNTVYLRLDAFILNAVGGTGPVGIYSIAVTLNERIWALDGAISQAVLPHVVGQEKEEAARLTALTGRTILGLTSIVAVVLAAASPWLLPLMYGNAFRASVLPLILLLPGTVLYSVGKTFANYLSGQLGKPELSSRLALITAVASVPIYAALIPAFGAVGAAAGSTLAYTLGFFVALYLFRKNAHLSIGETLTPTRRDWDLYVDIARRVLNKAFGRP